MAPRKRKIQVPSSHVSPEKVKHSTALYKIVLNSQQSETVHNKCIKELKNLYAVISHDSFMMSFIQAIKNAMEKEELNEYGNNMLQFCAKFVTSFDNDDTHPAITSTFNWLLNTISSSSLIRFKICQFVNLILNYLGVEAALDDVICDKILRYMIERMRDIRPNVRVQAVLALQRLQDPENPEDSVFKAYIYHLENDPSPKVRQTIITSIGRNYNTMPHIIERLWDTDEKVRRHTYLQMSSYQVKAYKVAQRLTFLEQGLNDHAESVRKVVKNVLLPQWIEFYGKNYFAFTAGLKIDANETEMERFRSTAKMALQEIFKKHKVEDIITCLELNEEKMIPLEKLTIERVIVWQAVLEYLQKEASDDLDLVMVEISSFCPYIQCFAESYNPNNDKWQAMYYQFILLTLLEMISTYDFGDEFGKESLKKVFHNILHNHDLDDRNIKLIVQLYECLITDRDARFKYLVDLIRSIIEPRRSDFVNSRSVIDEYLEKNPDKTLQFKISSLKLKIMDLTEQEMNMVEKKEYAAAQKAADELAACNEELSSLLQPIIDSSSERSSLIQDSLLRPTKVTSEQINKCLQIAFHMVVSKSVDSITPVVCDLYKDFIVRHIESTEIVTRDWALQCGTAYSMLYDGLSKEIFQVLYQQFYRNHSTRIWKTSVECIFELLDKYGFEHFDLDDKQDKSRKSGRQLFSAADYSEQDEGVQDTSTTGTDLMRLMTHFLETCDDSLICSTIIEGFCRIILRGHFRSLDIVSKLMLKFFNPSTDTRMNQILGIFFEALIKKKEQELLQKSLLQTLFIILEAPYDSPLQEIKPENVLKFVIDATRPIYCSPGLNLHNTIAMSFIQTMLDNLSYKDLLKILSRELLTLEISDDNVLKHDLIGCVEKLLSESELDPKTIKNITSFKQMLEGTYKEPLQFSSSNMNMLTQPTHDSDGEPVDSDHENHTEQTENQESAATENTEKGAELEKEEEAEQVQDPPLINRSSISDPETIPGTPPRSGIPTTFGHTNRSGMRSLRKSLSVRAEGGPAPFQFKVPEGGSATKKLKKKKNYSTSTENSVQSDEASWSIPLTQEQTILENEETVEHVDIPATQQVAIRVETEEEEKADKSPERTPPNKEVNEEDEVVLPSPTSSATKPRRVKGTAKSKLAIFSTPKNTTVSSPRTRRTAVKEIINSKVMTRKSLGSLTSGSTSIAGIVALDKSPVKTVETRKSTGSKSTDAQHVGNKADKKKETAKENQKEKEIEKEKPVERRGRSRGNISLTVSPTTETTKTPTKIVTPSRSTRSAAATPNESPVPTSPNTSVTVRSARRKRISLEDSSATSSSTSSPIKSKGKTVTHDEKNSNTVVTPKSMNLLISPIKTRKSRNIRGAISPQTPTLTKLASLRKKKP